MAEPAPDLIASISPSPGAASPIQNTFIERCEAAAAAGFSGIGLHADDLPRARNEGVDVGEMQAVLRVNGLGLVEVEFLGCTTTFCGTRGPNECSRGRVNSSRRIDPSSGAQRIRRPYCVEVNTPEFRALPVDEAARQAADTANEVLAAARRQSPPTKLSGAPLT